MIANRIIIVAIQAPSVGSLKTLIHLQVKDLEPESLRFSNFIGVGGDLDLKVVHSPLPVHLAVSGDFFTTPLSTAKSDTAIGPRSWSNAAVRRPQSNFSPCCAKACGSLDQGMLGLA